MGNRVNEPIAVEIFRAVSAHGKERSHLRTATINTERPAESRTMEVRIAERAKSAHARAASARFPHVGAQSRLPIVPHLLKNIQNRWGRDMKTKGDTISEIMRLNPSVGATFLSEFNNDQLVRYLRRLRDLRDTTRTPDQAFSLRAGTLPRTDALQTA